ncbi:unnamed protein product [Natator depressus]
MPSCADTERVMGILQLLSLLMGLLATAASGAEGRLVEQSSPYLMVRLGASESVTCTLKDTTYSWMSWYLQDVQSQLHFLVQSGTKGDPEEISLMETSYTSERVSNTELRLEIKNVTQSQTIYCTCSTGHSERAERRWPQKPPLVQRCLFQWGNHSPAPGV